MQPIELNTNAIDDPCDDCSHWAANPNLHTIDALREIAEAMAEGTPLTVDYESFDEAKKQMNEYVSVNLMKGGTP